ncbi:GMC family oxidoreductase [Bacillus canaveralius]|uniref:GMC family oxidoreductase n=1 Tax=Bacillus canaveralius TaxID=1403243 RepID=A0A2N5GL90_9BACI|nr:GMC family oxidoreductase [Bacillus canaveralius]PLR82308.1 GMC family oxidoreductase [Bacillus canaveralius]PLR99455.1 GMC family oxidoreductase [Bacillus canaveralius]RSK49108.1 GMC family oxidoreductase [Bacillus canaveralius]
MTKHYDAIVVGLGASGGIIATELARAGLKVVGLEKGAFYKEQDFLTKFDEIRYYCRSAMVPHMRTDPITWRSNNKKEAVVLPWASNKLGLGDPFQTPPSIGTGGGTRSWGAASFRFRESDFKMRSLIVERFSESALQDDTTVVDWPVSYEDLEPYYDKVEWELGVAGKPGNINGEVQEGGNPFESPRKRDYPMPPLPRAGADKLFTEAARKLGYHPFATPTGIATIDYKGRSACTNCGFCHGYHCHVGAKLSTHELVSAANKETDNLEIRQYVRVFKVNRDSSGHVHGVSYFDSEGNVVEVTADIVILSCYALENARLLLASGINESGHVGKHLSIHNYGWFTGIMPEITNPFMGSLQSGSVLDDLTSELIPDNEEGVLWGSPINTWTGDMQPIETVHSLPPHVPKWGKGLKDWLSENYRKLFKMYSQHSTLPSEQFYVDLDPKVKDPFGQPALRITHDWTEYDRKTVEYFMKIKRQLAREMGMKDWWEDSPTPNYHVTVHDTGTHRMGWDPAASVVNPYGEVHECKGLFAVGGGQFPTLPSYNPTETIMALAYLTSDHILGRSAVGKVEKMEVI